MALLLSVSVMPFSAIAQTDVSSSLTKLGKRYPGSTPLISQRNQKRIPSARKIYKKPANTTKLYVNKSNIAKPSSSEAKATLKSGTYIPSAYAVLSYNPAVDIDSLPYITSFQLKSPLTFPKKSSALEFPPSDGSGLKDGKLYGAYHDLYGYNDFKLYIVSYDLETGEMLSCDPVDGYSLEATETANDPTNGSVFGQFYTDDETGLEYGYIDYAAKSRTTIAPATKKMVAIGISPTGEAYGISLDGNLYNINKSTGAETLVGYTGIPVGKKDGTYFAQSGEIDPKSGTFYWAASDSLGNYGLYTVNLQNGNATLIADGDFQLYSMNIPAPEAEEGAPAAASDLTANFTDNSLNGTIAFKAPATTFSGDPLTGEINYTITANGTQIATGSTVSGASVSREVTVSEGLNVIEVTTSNNEGTSPKAKLTKYVGNDLPVAPSNVRLTINEDNLANVTWDAPTSSVHGGWLGQLTYNVYRIAKTDTVEVANGITETSFSETIPVSSRANYHYGIRAVNTTQSSAMATSNGQIIGDAYEVPYLENFDDPSSIEEYTIIDANNDGSTWEYYASDYNNEKAVRYSYSSINDADDWLISPPINLKGGKTYNVSYKVRSYERWFPERIEAKWGQGNTVAAMTEALTDSTDVTDEDYKLIHKEITPTTDGEYNFGFHAISDKDNYYLFIDSISVTPASDSAAPDSVTNLKAIADPTGALNATLSFSNPTKNITGDQITELDSIEIQRGQSIIGVIKPATAGQAETFTDNNALQGVNEYTVTAYNSKGAGRKSTVSVFVGIDTPEAPNVSATDNLSSVTLSWPTVKGENGGIIVADDVNYEISSVNENGTVTDSISSVKGQNEYTLDYNTTEGEQRYKRWAVRAVNSAGFSGWDFATVLVGAPYTLPFSNSLKGGTLEDQFLGVITDNDAIIWNVSNEKTYDNDGGALVFSNTYYYSYAGEATATTGKISLTGARNPKLYFCYYADPNTDAKLIAEVEHSNGTVDSLWSTDFTTSTTSKWQTADINLPLSVVTEPYSLIRFRGVANSENSVKLYVDNIHVADPYQYDAAISVTAPETINKGQSANIIAKVSNQGLEQLAGLEVKISVNDEVVKDTTISRSLVTFEDVEIPVNYNTSSMLNASSLNVKAEVINGNDLDDTNNTAVATTSLVQADVNAPTNLKGTSDGQLSWTAPETNGTVLTEDFDNYTAWITSNVGDWTFLNEDGGIFGQITDSGVDPNAGAEAAYEIWHPSGIFAPGQGLDPHSGSQCLASIAKFSTATQKGINSDDWIISPELSGNEQTITFWVNNMKGSGYGTETFQILTSSTDQQTSSFTQLGSDYTQSSGKWTMISVDVPEGSRYFAIRRTTTPDDAFIFFVDDITLESGHGVVSYNIYIDGEYAGNTADTSYTVNNSDGAAHTYSVTAIYSDGSESQPVSLDLIVTGIDGIHSAIKAGRYDIYTLGGALVRSNASYLSGLASGIYVINGKKVLVK